MLMAWCFSTRASVATVLTMHPCISRCLGVESINSLSPWRCECYIKLSQSDFIDWYLQCLLWNGLNMRTTGHGWWQVNIGPDNGLVLSVNKLSWPMLAIMLWCHMAHWAIMSSRQVQFSHFVLRKFHHKHSEHNTILYFVLLYSINLVSTLPNSRIFYFRCVKMWWTSLTTSLNTRISSLNFGRKWNASQRDLTTNRARRMLQLYMPYSVSKLQLL